MSSPKDYNLEITPSLDESNLKSLNLLKFTVNHKEKDFINKYKSLLSVILGCSLIAVIGNSYLKTSNVTHTIRDPYVIILSLALSVILLRQTPEDTLIVIRGFGVQLKTKKAWRFQNSTDSFIPIKDMIDLMIHEGFHGYGQVIFYLCVLTRSTAGKGDNVIKVVFPEFLPRKDILLTVWKSSRELLFGSTNRYWRRVPGKGLKQI
ncbi:uncharacterized protein J8A68_004675 [[Candida] subhashii]|uniref:Phosphatidylinositol N-acetylglucosaminyltransferase subunit H conserved domain-containing protein n=1 Tax=[Candida] subhashii TaxID=561895 RepID=A0A8J5UWQ9_9ASCO|nr:uncharacterized protein J8A68_004675 [[Candida] subhashii]KAG7661819.1 hypothetical protein J8A68_004675 [[Candida] subhashii]